MLSRELDGLLSGHGLQDPVPVEDENVTGKLVVDALTELRPGMTVAWTPSVEEGAAFLRSVVRPGDRVVTMGAGDVDQAAAVLLEALG